ncbi:hypothetical protein [Occultella kanbiaonis]|uniref:hypothetical protein n=1 Tax=Occultella kanbiaonis TaxID=2675754 RepID=UPI00143CD274|nr:hypothetical protein [Occultella kanbiaonis]
MQYNCLTLEIDEKLAGIDLGPSVPVGFLGSGDRSPDADTTVPAGTVVVFLVDKGGEEAGRYRAVSSYGLWVASDRGSLDQPIREEQPQADEPEVRDPLANADDVDELVEWLRDRL